MNFSYNNKNYHQSNKRKEHFSNAWLKKALLASFILCFCFMLIGKITLIFKNKKTAIILEETKKTKKNQLDINIPSLVINLKSKEGPRLARISVLLKTDQKSVKKTLLSKNQSIEKFLLLVLSGQNEKDISKKKTFFEKKIKKQINAFLSNGSINEVNLNTKIIN